jgi:hypothetical protein
MRARSATRWRSSTWKSGKSQSVSEAAPRARGGGSFCSGCRMLVSLDYSYCHFCGSPTSFPVAPERPVSRGAVLMDLPKVEPPPPPADFGAPRLVNVPKSSLDHPNKVVGYRDPALFRAPSRKDHTKAVLAAVVVLFALVLLVSSILFRMNG